MLRPLLYSSFLAVIFTFFIAPLAFANTVNDAGAAQLKTMLSEILQEKKQSVADSGATLITNGDILVQPASDYYNVTLPNISIKNANNTTSKIGVIKMNAVPTTDPNNWKMNIILPPTMMMVDSVGKTTTQFNVGQQNMSGDWDNKLKIFSNLNAKYNALKITDFINNQTTAFDEIKIVSNSIAKNDDIISTLKLNIANMVVASENAPDPLLPEKLNVNLDLSNVPYNQLTDFTNKYLAPAQGTTQNLSALAIFQDFLKSFSNTDMGLKLTNSQMTSPLYNANMNADFKAAPNSDIGVAGILNLKIEGLEKSVQSLSEKRKNVSGAELEQLNNALNILTIVQLTSQKDGNSHLLKFEVDKNSNIFLNGQDISALLVSGL